MEGPQQRVGNRDSSASGLGMTGQRAGNDRTESRQRNAPMIRYELIIYWSKEDEAFVAEVPELPGCAADGRTYREALANAEKVIAEWTETATELGRPIPEPKGRLAFA